MTHAAIYELHDLIVLVRYEHGRGIEPAARQLQRASLVFVAVVAFILTTTADDHAGLGRALVSDVGGGGEVAGNGGEVLVVVEPVVAGLTGAEYGRDRSLEVGFVVDGDLLAQYARDLVAMVALVFLIIVIDLFQLQTTSSRSINILPSPSTVH